MRRRLGVNIDHVATLRQARGTRYPDPVAAAALVEAAGGLGVSAQEPGTASRECSIR